MAQRQYQLDLGPAKLHLINVVPRNDLFFEMQIDHDISGSTFEAEVVSGRGDLVAAFMASGVAPLASGLVNVSMGAADTALLSDGCVWHFDEITGEGRKTLLAGNVEMYTL